MSSLQVEKTLGNKKKESKRIVTFKSEDILFYDELLITGVLIFQTTRECLPFQTVPAKLRIGIFKQTLSSIKSVLQITCKNS